MVLSADPETRRLKLGMKQLEATAADQFAKEVAVGDRVTGRILKVKGNEITVQLGEGVEGVCILEQTQLQAPAATAGMSMAEQLAAAWKGGVKAPEAGAGAETYREGELRSFTIKAIDAEGKKIRLQPA